MTSLPPDLREHQRPITVQEYHRMVDAGILTEDEGRSRSRKNRTAKGAMA